MQNLLDQMSRRVMRHTQGLARETAIPRVGIGLAHQPSAPIAVVYEPIVCLVLQGAKEVMIGDRVVRYDPASYFVATLELPASGRIVEASRDQPYLATSLTLDRDLLAELIAHAPEDGNAAQSAFGVAPVTEPLLAAWDHLIELLDRPQDVPVLAPLREREVLYRLLQGPCGDVLRQVARADSRLARVRRAIHWLQAHYQEAVRMDRLAEIAGMSLPSFHRQFKAATAMSPLQFQKKLRLQAARRMLASNAEASRTAYSVGYESASQFSREYARMFGLPPSRDARRLRAAAPEEVGLA